MATEISKLAVVLNGNIDGFTASMQKGGADVGRFKEKTVSAADGMKKFGAAGEKVSSIFSGLGGVLATVGASFLGAAGLEKFAAQEQSVAKLDSVLRSTGEAAGFSSGELQRFAADLQEVTTFGHEATVTGEAILATFTNIRGDQFKEAVRASQDLSTVLGQELKPSVIQIGKALNDPAKGFTALKRAGVSFTQAQVDQIKVLQASGDIIGAQKIILKELANEFGGAAEAVGGTFAGKVTQAKNAIGDMVEVIVGSAAPAIVYLANASKAAAQWVAGHAKELRVLGYVTVGVVAAIAAYKGAMLALNIANKAWAAGQAIVLALQGPGGWLKLAAAAVIATAAVLSVEAAFDDIAEKAGPAGAGGDIAGIRQEMTAIGEEGDAAAAGIEKVAKAVKSVADALKDAKDLVGKLQDESETFGFRKGSAERFKSRAEFEAASAAAVKKHAEDVKALKQLEAQSEGAGHDVDNMRAAGATLDNPDLKSDVERRLRLMKQVKKMQGEVGEFDARQAKARADFEAYDREAAAIDDVLRLKEADKKLNEEMARDADKIAAAIRSPFEKLQDELDHIDYLSAMKGIDDLMAEQAKLKAQIDFQNTIDKDKDKDKKSKHKNSDYKPPSPEALERRFTAGFSSDAANAKLDKMEKHAANSERYLKDAAGNLKKIKDQGEGQKVVAIR